MKTLSTFILTILIAVGCAAAQDAVNYKLPFVWPAGATTNDVCGLYVSGPNGFPVNAAGVMWPATNLYFSVTNPVAGAPFPNPANVCLQMQRGAQTSPYSQAITFDTNSFPYPLGVPVPGKVSAQF